MCKKNSIVVLACLFCFSAFLCSCATNTITADVHGIEAKFRQASNKKADQKLRMTATLFTPEQKEKIREGLSVNEDRELQISDDGKIVYNNFSQTDDDASMNISEKQAVSQAKKYLEDLGLTSEGDYALQVSYTQRTPVNITDSVDTRPAQIQEWAVWFLQTYDGVPVFHKDSIYAIRLSFTHNGITSLHYQWYTILQEERQVPQSSLLSISEAIEFYELNILEYWRQAPQKIQYQQVYITDDDMRAVTYWVFSDDSMGFLGNPLIINGETGEVWKHC